MSRSYRKNPGCSSRKLKKLYVKQAQKKLRNFKGETSNGNWYKKVGRFQWDISDYSGGRISLEDYVYDHDYWYESYRDYRFKVIERWEKYQTKIPAVKKRMEELEKEYEYYHELGMKQTRIDIFGDLRLSTEVKLREISKEYDDLKHFYKWNARYYTKNPPSQPVSKEEWLRQKENSWKKKYKCK